MRDHEHEEDRVEPGKGTVEAGHERPHEREVHVARVVDLARVCVW